MKISYAITVHDEIDEIKKLIPFLLKNIKNSDEIVVLMDDKGPTSVWNYLMSIEHSLSNLNRSEFTENFSDWKNTLNSMCSGDYIFQIDADEIPNEFLIEHIHDVLKLNPDIDLILVPRVNIVNGLTDTHIQKWNWQVNERGWVNYPDPQWRIYRNDPSIKWINKVHEVIDGYKTVSALPSELEWSLYHIKDIEKQEKQNEFYETL
jgi:glycosyltransferase involved in cell wall biosynthesis